MKPKHICFPTLVALGLVMPASADVIYSNLQDISIPAHFDGLYLDVDGTNGWNTNMAEPVAGWDINPFYGGRALANSPAFQPVRGGTDSFSPIVKLAGGVSVGTGSVFSTFVQEAGGETPGAPGYGGSPMLTGAGGNFTAGQEGYLGFKLYTDASYTAANFGWMRVVLTNNTGGALIKDWAYDTGGTAINTGNVLQSAAENSAQTVTLSSASGSFTLGSAITNTGGNTNSVIKTGAGTTTLAGNNTHTGDTTIQQGTLALGSSGSIANSTTLIVGDVGSSSAVLDVSAVSGGFTVGATQTLKGIGSVTGNVVVNGMHAPGNSPGLQTVNGNLTYSSGSIFEWDLNANVQTGRGSAYDAVDVGAGGTLTVDSGAIFKIVLGSGVTADPFWTTPGVPRTWSDVFMATTLVGAFNTANIQVTGPGAANTGMGSFTITGTSLTWTAVPEPTSALVGLLIGAGLLRRRRR